MPGSIPELSEIGPKVSGDGEHSLKDEVRNLLNRRTTSFPGIYPRFSLDPKYRGTTGESAETTFGSPGEGRVSFLHRRC